MRDVYAIEAQLAELKAALIVRAEETELAALEGATSLKAWLRDHTMLAPGEAKRQIDLAHALTRHTVVREALARGEFPPASAQVIVHAVDALPVEADGWVVEQAEKHLTAEAHVHDTQTLGRLARHLDEVIDPEGADQRLAEQLARAEEAAARRVFLHLRHDEAAQTTEGLLPGPVAAGGEAPADGRGVLEPEPARPPPHD